jgi:hypothetical protein
MRAIVSMFSRSSRRHSLAERLKVGETSAMRSIHLLRTSRESEAVGIRVFAQPR